MSLQNVFHIGASGRGGNEASDRGGDERGRNISKQTG